MEWFIVRVGSMKLPSVRTPNKRLERTRRERASLLSNLGEPLKRNVRPARALADTECTL